MINATQNRPSVFSPLAKAVLDSIQEGVAVFDGEGELIYANRRAQDALGQVPPDGANAQILMPQLARLGGRVNRLRINGMQIGEAVFLPPSAESGSLAAREHEAIVKTLDRTGWRLAETAKELGISRTTLWRRLKAYGLHRDNRGNWD